MTRFAFVAGLGGLLLFTLLVAWSGLEDVVGAVASAGWATAAVVGLRAAALAAEGGAWQLLFPPGQGLGVAVAVFLRFVREAVNQLLPVAAVGGDVVGARLATFWRVDGALAAATTFADVAVQAGTQFVFALVGLGVLVYLQGDGDLVRYVAVGLAIAAIGIAAFIALQHGRGGLVLDRVLRRLAGGRDWRAAAFLRGLYDRLGHVYAAPGRVLACALIHLAVWFFGALEVYVALHFMGYPVTFMEAVVIESLGQAVRGAAFAVPGGLGIQEGGFIALCALFGIPAGPALALSLVKRVADLALGLPCLVAWQAIEGRRLLTPAPLPEPRP